MLSEELHEDLCCIFLFLKWPWHLCPLPEPSMEGYMVISVRGIATCGIRPISKETYLKARFHPSRAVVT